MAKAQTPKSPSNLPPPQNQAPPKKTTAKIPTSPHQLPPPSTITVEVPPRHGQTGSISTHRPLILLPRQVFSLDVVKAFNPQPAIPRKNRTDMIPENPNRSLNPPPPPPQAKRKRARERGKRKTLKPRRLPPPPPQTASPPVAKA